MKSTFKLVAMVFFIACLLSQVACTVVGPVGPPGLSGYQLITVAATHYGPWWEVNISPPSGKKVISGGYQCSSFTPTTSTNIIVFCNGPSASTPAGDRGWEVKIYDPGAVLPGVTGFAICASVR